MKIIFKNTNQEGPTIRAVEAADAWYSTRIDHKKCALYFPEFDSFLNYIILLSFYEERCINNVIITLAKINTNMFRSKNTYFHMVDGFGIKCRSFPFFFLLSFFRVFFYQHTTKKKNYLSKTIHSKLFIKILYSYKIFY